MLGPDELARVESAIREAERHTAGEIVLVIARRAASYRSVPLLLALGAALLVPAPLLLLSRLAADQVWLVQAVVAALALLLASPEAVRPRLVPDCIRRARAREAAEREFAARGLARTRGRTGILLYLAMAERHAEVIGDVAIAGRVPEAAWRAVI
ncbi:MAG: hypothetical protein JO048_12630, partial [Methylobacteriaceae bacterium]|nr:hypothetical protein [Methylobacteriaceae bacterium]